MNQTIQTPNTANLSKHDEQILVVARDTFFKTNPVWHGIKSDNFDHYTQIVREHQQFLPRSSMENDPNYKQIIPYLLFCYQDKYFLMERSAQATEKRLQSKFSLGIGGHIRQEDITAGDIIEWAYREFHEEVNYTGNLTIKPLGILNDDTNAVGAVHIGFVYTLYGDSPTISVKSELKQGMLVTVEECTKFYDKMESWSQLVLNNILKQKQ
jgi:predicted NUDIX family phosphoesterase